MKLRIIDPTGRVVQEADGDYDRPAGLDDVMLYLSPRLPCLLALKPALARTFAQLEGG